MSARHVRTGMGADTTTTLASFEEYAASVRGALDAAFASQLLSLVGDMRPARLAGPAGVLTGGKKTRGTLLCLVASTLGGTLESALPRAVAVELIQTATLIHDDYVDQHPTRRGGHSLWTLEGGRKAVLLGDVLFASAIHMMSEMGPVDGALVSRAIADVARGAYQEPLDPLSLIDEIEAGRMNAALYEKIIHLKTGVLFGVACRLGALAARALDEEQQAWLRYGLRLGEAYQIADDLQEVRKHLVTRRIDQNAIAALAPALLRFAPQIRPLLLLATRSECSTLDDGLLSHFLATENSMTLEIERRSEAAVSEVEATLPDNDQGVLARETPRGLVALFNEASSRTSCP